MCTAALVEYRKGKMARFTIDKYRTFQSRDYT
jgi:hypothetical protein